MTLQRLRLRRNERGRGQRGLQPAEKQRERERVSVEKAWEEKGEVEKRKGKRGAPMFPYEWKRARDRKGRVSPICWELSISPWLVLCFTLHSGFSSSFSFSPAFVRSFVRSFFLSPTSAHVHLSFVRVRSHFISSAILLRLYHHLASSRISLRFFVFLRTVRPSWQTKYSDRFTGACWHVCEILRSNYFVEHSPWLRRVSKIRGRAVWDTFRKYDR